MYHYIYYKSSRLVNNFLYKRNIEELQCGSYLNRGWNLRFMKTIIK